MESGVHISFTRWVYDYRQVLHLFQGILSVLALIYPLAVLYAHSHLQAALTEHAVPKGNILYNNTNIRVKLYTG